MRSLILFILLTLSLSAFANEKIEMACHDISMQSEVCSDKRDAYYQANADASAMFIAEGRPNPDNMPEELEQKFEEARVLGIHFANCNMSLVEKCEEILKSADLK